MPESTQSIFLRIARDRGLIDEDAMETIVGLQTLDRMRGHARTVEALCVRERLLTADVARRIMSGVRLYALRKCDRKFARLAVRRWFITPAAYAGSIARQRAILRERSVLVRLQRILVEMGALTAEQTALVWAELRGTAGATSRRARRVAMPSLRRPPLRMSGRHARVVA